MSRRYFDDQFKLNVLKDYYESVDSYYQIARKYESSSGNIIAWERKYTNKSVSLATDIDELEKQVFMAKSTREKPSSTHPLTEEKKLREKNARLRNSLEYSELRNETLHEVLKIGREQYNIDL